MTHKAKLLVAATNYEEMFGPLLKLEPKQKATVSEQIKWAKQALKKADRIIWYLKWTRLTLADSLRAAAEIASDRLEEPDETEVLALTKLIDKWSREGGMNLVKGSSYPWKGWPLLKTQLEHYFSLPVPAIANYSPKAESPRQLLEVFHDYEEGFKKEQKSLLTPQDDDYEWMTFPDGWAWWHLPRASCDAESKAMGHCGNSPAAGSTTQSILSLRQPKPYGKETKWEPHLTFILHAGGVLGEMKGKGNDKPVQRYHQYIIPLLEDHRISGVSGGGYMPENNFSLDDLTDEQREEIKAKNPDIFMTLREFSNEHGSDDERVVARIQALLGIKGMLRKDYIYRQYSDTDEFIDSYGTPEAELLYEYAHGNVGNRGNLIEVMRYRKDDDALMRNVLRAMEIEDPKFIAQLRESGVGRTSQKGSDQRLVLAALNEDYRKDHFPHIWKVLEEAAKAGAPDEDKALAAIDEAISQSVNFGRIYEDNYGSLYWLLSPSEALYQAEEVEKYGENEEREDPYVSIDEEQIEEQGLKPDEDKTTAVIYEAFHTDPVAKPAHPDQKRLYPEPKNDYELERGGIKHSYLLQPKTAAAYDDMFQGVIALAPDVAPRVKEFIQWAKTTLKKQDRIVWYLRWARLSVLLPLSNDHSEQNPNREKLSQMYNKLYQEAAQKSGASADLISADLRNYRRVQTDLAHFYSLGIDAIEKTIPKFECPDQLCEKFVEYEEAAQDEADEDTKLLEPQDGDEIFIQLEGKWAWWELDRWSCDQEADAMGHCGNAAGDSDDHILSLREMKRIAGKEYWEPHLTFILKPGGIIGEMKGRGNEKPVERYHNAIVALLSDSRIKMTRGGGYKPENNFTFYDLSHEDQKKVKAANPSFVPSIEDEYHKHGVTEMVQNFVKDTIDVEYTEGIGFVLDNFGTTMEMLDRLGDDTIREHLADFDFSKGGDIDAVVAQSLDGIADGDLVLANIVQSFINEFPGLAATLGDVSEPTKQFVADLAVSIGDKYPDSETLKLLVVADHADPAVVQEIYEKWSDRDGGSAYLFEAKDGEWYYIADDEHVIEAAVRGYDLDHIAWPKLEYKEGLFGFDVAQTFAHPLPAPKRPEQGRLYKEPETNAEAQDMGIKHSYLLSPKKTACLSKGAIESLIERIAATDDLSSGNCGMFALGLSKYLTEQGTKPTLTFFLSNGAGSTLAEVAKSKHTEVYHVGVVVNGQLFDGDGEQHESNIRDLIYESYKDTRPTILTGIAPTDPMAAKLIEKRTDWSTNAADYYDEIVEAAATDKQASISKQALEVSPTGEQYMQLSGDKIVDDATVGDYELFILKSGIIPGVYLLGMQRVGDDAFDLSQQMREKNRNVGKGTRQEFKQVINAWLQKYHQLVIGSHNPEKTRKYETMLKALGYPVKSKTVMGMPLPYIESASKTASINPDDFPKPVIARAEQMLGDTNPDIPGDVQVLNEEGRPSNDGTGWWVETHTIGCRNAADDAEEDWLTEHWAFFDKYQADGISLVLGDPADGKFVTITPQKNTKQAAASATGFDALNALRPSLRDIYIEFAQKVPGSRDNIAQSLRTEGGLKDADADSLADFIIKTYAPSAATLKQRKQQQGQKPTVFTPGKGVSPVYHGTSAEFDTFDPETIGSDSGNRGFLGAGFYFSARHDIASAYGEVGAYSLDVHKPLVINDPLSEEAANFLNEVTESPGYFVAGETPVRMVHNALSDAISNVPELADEITAKLEELGYDAVFYNNMDEIMVYSPSVIEKLNAAAKVAFISPTQGELTVVIDGGQRPKVTLSLDLGIPNFTRFAISANAENMDSSETDLFCRQAFEALLQNITAFLLSLKYDEAEIAEVLGSAEDAFIAMDAGDASDAKMPNRDNAIRMYEMKFPLPEFFVNETRSRVVTASTVRRLPETRTLELTPIDAVTEQHDPASILEFYLDQATKTTPRPFSVQVIDAPEERRKAHPRPGDWESRLLQTA